MPGLGARGTFRVEFAATFTLEARIAQQLHQTVHRLATRAARRYHWVGYPELMQFGSEHALKLCHRFDPSRASFGTFIHRSVGTAMRRRAQQIQREAARLVPDVISCDDLPADYITPPNSAPSSSSATSSLTAKSATPLGTYQRKSVRFCAAS